MTICADSAEKCAEFIARRIQSGQLTLESLFAKTELHPKCGGCKINWIFFVDLLNFSFWTDDSEPKYRVTFKGVTYDGYLAFCAAVNRTLETQGVPLTDPNYFGDVSEVELDGFLVGDHDVSCPMIKERVACLHQAARALKAKYASSVLNLIRAADKSAVNLLRLLCADFECFRDGAEFHGRQVSLLKRAQIFVSDLWSLHDGFGFGAFYDLEAEDGTSLLTMFADYRVPQSLQYFGVLRYSDALKAKLAADTLANGCEFEVEIRGCSIRAVELITTALKKSHPRLKCNESLIDYFLWEFRREKADEMTSFPFHKTRSIYY